MILKKDLLRWPGSSVSHKGDREIVLERPLVCLFHPAGRPDITVAEFVCIGMTFGGWLIAQNGKRYLPQKSTVRRFASEEERGILLEHAQARALLAA